ncbi:hypothetical protein D9M71_829030 [compost metagenome]
MVPGLRPSRICSLPTCTSIKRSRGPSAREPINSITCPLPAGPACCTRRNSQARKKISPSTSNKPSTSCVNCPATPLLTAGAAAALATGSAASTRHGNANPENNPKSLFTQRNFLMRSL